MHAQTKILVSEWINRETSSCAVKLTKVELSQQPRLKDFYTFNTRRTVMLYCVNKLELDIPQLFCVEFPTYTVEPY